MIPVLAVEGISDALAEFVRNYVPKLWAVVEFSIVVEPSAKSLVAGTKTPVWGGACYRKTRREAHDLLTPE